VETRTGVGFDVEPAATDRPDGWCVDASMRIEFNSGDDGLGFEGLALAVFGDEGAPKASLAA
jgi:hypothetical protein